jgi:toluene monooxygenase system protein E
LQMTAAYVGALAPSGRISVAAAFQAADELRRIQRLCQWLSRSGTSSAELDALGRELWQQDAAFQPLRKLIEELLVTYDWGQALIAMNGVIKPIFDRLWFEQLARVAAQHDEVLQQTLSSLGEDGQWHEAWFIALAELVVVSNPKNLSAVACVSAEVRQQALRALRALLPAFAGLWGDEAACGRLSDELAETQLGRLGVLGAV